MNNREFVRLLLYFGYMKDMKYTILFGSEVEEEEVLEVDTDTENPVDLVVWNDDVHTFDFVIQSLVEICGHDLTQAEQCTYIVHFNGKCAVKSGSLKKLKPMYRKLLNRGLTATLED